MPEPKTRRIWLLQLLTIGLGILFISKPVHIDEANFLSLASGPVLAPHSIDINWQGTTESAFAVLSNPPGIAWWLSPFSESPIFIQRLWMLPWSCLAVFGIWTLGTHYIPHRREMLCLISIFSPVFFMANGALMPDMPLMACILAGMGMMVSNPKRAEYGILLIGAGVLFRYSAVALWPVVFLQGYSRGGIKFALRYTSFVVLPMILLMAFDFYAYSQWHFGAMLGFQTEGGGITQSLIKSLAALASLAGAVVPPFLFLGRREAFAAAILGGISLVLLVNLGLMGFPLFWTTVLVGFGGGILTHLMFNTSSQNRILLAWFFFGLGMLILLRFIATRYWAPFFVPALILALQSVSRKACLFGLSWSVLLSFALALDDFEMAQAQRILAMKVHDAAGGPGVFSGHWGWQRHLEKEGWKPIEEDQLLQTDVFYARSLNSWPQEGLSSCLEPKGAWLVEDRWPGPRVHTLKGRGNIHAYMISVGPTWAIAPWSFGDDPHDVVELFKVCVGTDGRGG